MYNTLTGALQKIISRSNQSINIMPLPILPARVRKSANSTGEPKKSNVSKVFLKQTLNFQRIFNSVSLINNAESTRSERS